MTLFTPRGQRQVPGAVDGDASGAAGTLQGRRAGRRGSLSVFAPRSSKDAPSPRRREAESAVSSRGGAHPWVRGKPACCVLSPGAFLRFPRVCPLTVTQGSRGVPRSEHASPHACARVMPPGAVGSATAEKGSLRAGHPQRGRLLSDRADCWAARPREAAGQGHPERCSCGHSLSSGPARPLAAGRFLTLQAAVPASQTGP